MFIGWRKAYLADMRPLESSAVPALQRRWRLQQEFTRPLILAGLLPALLLTAIVLWNDARSRRQQSF